MWLERKSLPFDLEMYSKQRAVSVDLFEQLNVNLREQMIEEA